LYFPPVFTEIRHPDFPVLPFAQGKLGILQPTYDRIYLYVAYRNLVGKGFSPEAARLLWDDRADLLGQPAEPVAAPAMPPEPVDWPRAWIDARNRVSNAGHVEFFEPYGLTPGIYREEHGPDNRLTYYLNCPPQAFQSAVETLRDRTQKYGAGSPELAAWARAQDQVFANCQKGETIPDPLSPPASALARTDRQYQIAAAYFYAGNFPKAEAGFREIAGKRDSPWSTIANYLIARAYIRQATVGHDDDSPDSVALTNAEAQLRRVLGDPKLAEFHTSASALLDYVTVRLHPEQRARELAQTLMKAPTPADLAQKAKDYTFLLDKLEHEQFGLDTPELQASRSRMYPQLADLRAHDDLTDWILTFQLSSPTALDHAYEEWEQRKALAWLVAALSKVQAGDPRGAKLLEAARAVPPSSPAYAHVTFHRLRLMRQSGQRAEVFPELNRLLTANRQTLPRSALNLFLALRMNYAKDLSDLLKYAQRVPLEISYNWGTDHLHPPAGSPWFDADGLIVLNQQMPLSVLVEAARSEVLPDYLRRQITLGAWTRAFLLDDDPEALKLAPELAHLAPEVEPYLATFLGAPDGESRRFAGDVLLLHFPGLRPYITAPGRSTPINQIDDLRENWWGKGIPCGLPWGQYGWADEPGTGAAQNTMKWPVIEPPFNEVYPNGTVPPPTFLSHDQLNTAEREWARTRSLPVAPIYLGEIALRWVRKHPEDPRSAEALALVVRAGHLGCADANRWKVSKQAFELLHGSYSASKWAKLTRHWYR
jgi:hypothetical protein